MLEQSGWFTRERLSTLTLLVLTALSLWVSYLVAKPLLPALAWAVAFAIIADPLHRRLARRMRPTYAAALSVLIVAVVIVGPIIFVIQQLAVQAAAFADFAGRVPQNGEFLDALRTNRYLYPLVRFIESQVSLEELLVELSKAVAAYAPAFVMGSLWGILQLVIALFVLFYLFRDRRLAVNRVRSLLPLAANEADEILRRVKDTVYAAVFGHVAVAMVQGTLGGVIFAILGLPAPVLWGAVMFALAIVPMLGAFVVWGPVAIYLTATGSWEKAIVLVLFGTFVIGLIDNVLYPILVGERLRLHTVPVFFAIIGGLALFGASGIVLGPVVLAVTFVLLDVWHKRTAEGRPAESAVEKPRAA